MSFFCFGGGGRQSYGKSHSRRRRSSSRRYPDFRFHDGTALPYRPLSPIHEMPRSIREVRPPGGKSFSQRVLSGGSSHHNRPSRHSRVGGHYAVDLESDSGYPEVRNGSLFQDILRPHRSRQSSGSHGRGTRGSDHKKPHRPNSWPHKLAPVDPRYSSGDWYSSYNYAREAAPAVQNVSQLPSSMYMRPRVMVTQPVNYTPRYSTVPPLRRKDYGIESAVRSSRKPKLKVHIPS